MNEWRVLGPACPAGSCSAMTGAALALAAAAPVLGVLPLN